MAYDDRPLYEINKPKSFSSKDWFDPSRMYNSSSSPSHLFTWYFEEKEKKRQGKYNEHDGYSMKAALKGVKNDWHSVVEGNQRLVEAFFNKLEGKSKDLPKAKEMWEELKKLKEETKNDENVATEFSTRTQVQSYMAPTPDAGLPSTENASPGGETDAPPF